MPFQQILNSIRQTFVTKRQSRHPFASAQAADVLELRVLPACMPPGGYFNPGADNPETEDNLNVYASSGKKTSGDFSLEDIGRFAVKIKCNEKTGIITLTANSKGVSGKITLTPESPGVYHFSCKIKSGGIADLHSGTLLGLL
ncbi:MAG: hypothetical protein U0903_11985 [Planctomycetales bacterium]